MGKKNRVDCADCAEFIPPKFKEDNWFSKMIIRPGCKLGKRVMFRQPKDFYDGGGWFRYCEDFNDRINEK